MYEVIMFIFKMIGKVFNLLDSVIIFNHMSLLDFFIAIIIISIFITLIRMYFSISFSNESHEEIRESKKGGK